MLFYNVSSYINKVYLASKFDVAPRFFRNVGIRRLGKKDTKLVNCWWVETEVWKYSRKDGKPDKRYRNNYLVPGMTYLVLKPGKVAYCLYSEEESDIADIVKVFTAMGMNFNRFRLGVASFV